MTLVKQALTGTLRHHLARRSRPTARSWPPWPSARRSRPSGWSSALDDADREKLRAALATQYGRPVHLHEIIDPAVLGGVRVEIADDVIDGTVVSRLDEARRRLAG